MNYAIGAYFVLGAAVVAYYRTKMQAESATAWLVAWLLWPFFICAMEDGDE